MTSEELAASERRVSESRRRQGLPARIESEVQLRRLVKLLRPGRSA
jgi:hypothetical protein